MLHDSVSQNACSENINVTTTSSRNSKNSGPNYMNQTSSGENTSAQTEESMNMNKLTTENKASNESGEPNVGESIFLTGNKNSEVVSNESLPEDAKLPSEVPENTSEESTASKSETSNSAKSSTEDNDSKTGLDELCLPAIEPPMVSMAAPAGLRAGFKPRGRAFKKKVVAEPASQFIMDVPEMWGVGADGSMMEVFNKLEIKD